MMTIVDTHVHLYPVHDAEALLESLTTNLSRAAPGAARAAVLVDGAGCDGFGRLGALGGIGVGRFLVRATVEAESLDVVSASGECVLRVVAGRQIVTAERLEVLALGTRAVFADGVAAARTIDAVLASGSLPVLAWAPGKWMGPRGECVAGLIRQFRGKALMLGDTSLRAVGWPTPRLMRDGVAAGLGRVCGSDPLPQTGEERMAGRYATRVAGPVDPAAPARSLCWLLRSAAAVPRGLTSAGQRSSPVGMIRRLLRHAAARKTVSGEH